MCSTRRRRVSLALPSISLLLAGCSIGSIHGLRVDTVDEAIARESNLIGQLVTVRGFLRFGDDARNLWSSYGAFTAVTRDDIAPDDPAWDRCITLFDIVGWREVLLRNHNKYILVTGTLRRVEPKFGDITISSCNELGISITKIDAIR